MKDNKVIPSRQAEDGGGRAGRERVDLSPPAEVRWIAEQLEDAGFSAWAVGGAVRDALAGGEAEDWDLATSAPPKEVQRIFRRTVPVGIEHGTVGVLGRSGQMYEVTTFRRDVETFGRKARVAFSDRLEEDLERRDFTINAVAWHPLTWEVRDPHGGVEDLRRGLLRTVGDPETRFREDRLRVLRALRFAGRFAMAIDPPTQRAIADSADQLDHLSPERIREELWKVLGGQRDASRTLRLYGEAGVLKALYPELEAVRQADSKGSDSWETTLRAVDAASPGRPIVRLAALFHRAATDVQADPDRASASAAIARVVLRRLRCSNAETDSVAHLLAQHSPTPSTDSSDAEVRRWLRRIGREYVNDVFRLLFALCRASAVNQTPGDLRRLFERVRRSLREGVPLTTNELAIGGDDLRALGIRPGPAYGEILRALLERVTEDPSRNDREVLLSMVKEGLPD